MDTTEDQHSLSSIGVGVAVAAALLAVLLSIFALGRALASDGPGTPAVTDGGQDGMAAAVVTVELTEFDIAPDPIMVAAGGTLEVANAGSAEHNLTVRDGEVGTADLAAGDTESLSVASLEPGTYDVLCDIPGHEAAGMVAQLVIGEGDAGDDPAADVGDDAGGEAELTGMERAEMLHHNYEESVLQFPAETAAMGNQLMTGEVQPDGSKLFELTISAFEWEVSPGEFVEAIGYNQQVPGPMIKVDVGDVVTVRLVNELEDQPTSLHPHGIFMHPAEVDGVGTISHPPIMPGDVYEVTFEAKEVSVGMYHGHDNGVEQVLNGAFGAWLVGDMPLPAVADNVVDEKVMVLNDAGNIGLTLNAKSFPATEPHVLKKGQQMLLHYYNEGLSPHPMHLHNNAQLVVAKDGYPLDSPYFADTINVAPGERYSVVVFAEVPGTWVFHCHILTHVERTDGSVFGMFTALVVEDSGDAELDAETERQLDSGREESEVTEGETGATGGETEATEEEASV